jgi:protein-disulfide isomerase
MLIAAGTLVAPGAILLAAPAKKPAAQIPATRDWTRTVVATPEGGFRMGNPAAPVKLVEYGSLTCPHCARFSNEATPALTATYVKTGRVSWEFRPYLLFPTDPGLSLLARCQGAATFFPLTKQIYAEQETWIGRLRQLPSEELQRIQALPSRERIAALLKAAELDAFFAQRGMPPARAQQCLGDQKALDALIEVTRHAQTLDVNSTPSFLINGKKAENVHDWASLEPLLGPPG